ncbi:MAG: dihydrolipoyl dehydrogenase [Nitrosopumilaceae archaeon]
MYDVVVIGAGPGGYVCAIEAAKLGGKVCLIEKNGLGGVCTQKGCIPTKYLHSMGDIVRRASSAKENGIDVKIVLNYKLLQSKMMATVSKLASGIKLLLADNGVDLIEGEAKIVTENKVMANGKFIETKNIVIATGSHPICLPGYDFGDKIISSDNVLDLQNLPADMVVVGGGYSGCEFASILNALGCKIWLVEIEDRLLPAQPEEIGKAVEKYMRLDGITVMTKSKVEKITDKEVIINGEKLESEKVLVCTGRKPNINSDELDKIGIKFNRQGIIVNEKMQTSIENVYAIGDVTGMYEVAHVASRQGEVAAQNIMEKESIMDYRAVPVCVFTYPEVAFVGECVGSSAKFPLTASAKANCLADTRGFIRVFEKNGICTGAIIIAPHAGELISEPTLAIKMQLKIKDVVETIHAHPTLPESFQDALRHLLGKSIHLPKAKSLLK